MRRIGLTVLACAAALMGSPIAARQSVSAERNAYDYALRCFTASTVATGDARYNPGGRNDATLKEGARKAYNVATVMGQRLGYSKARIEADLTNNGNVEGALMLRDDGYFQRARADCIRLGMM